jgi:hypothetical protein
MKISHTHFYSFGTLFQADSDNEAGKLSAALIQDSLIKEGALLLRGFFNRLEDFDAFSRRLPCTFMIHGAPVRKKVSADGYIQTVTEGLAKIVLHSEMHFSPISPDILFFYCEKAPTKGGETTLGDGCAFYEKLSPKHKTLLQKNRLKYWNAWPESTWRTYFPTQNKEEILTTMKKMGALAEFSGDELEFEFCISAFGGDKESPCFANGISIHEQYQNSHKLFHIAGDEKKTTRHLSRGW